MRDEGRQNRDMRREHCGLFAVSSQKIKGGRKSKSSKNDKACLILLEPCFSINTKDKKEIFFQVYELDFLKITF